ncbi:ubiquinol-cytochrome c reductase iron-sulfur subunit N-terminal domain-containing protein [Actinopolymorpha singaporensis]|uniref:Ubiquitinol-cytochrome C reductase Fe-S subunit TAT signal n=1 Tax=Actinopolymorpha singaporensis TaxID=117157 RepID=A0A1H1XVL1_9ACTN|nr:ubiquinol-cytochrome c reductase iron-sulfur subunit N-terminal domain-containing protein [Actinopolymorpha singaporensis]SDT12909.1 Ubiquitinol-cytochrome C reductase Fe-S subunit TAT signal [Actinopolymorpha singaporensis]
MTSSGPTDSSAPGAVSESLPTGRGPRRRDVLRLATLGAVGAAGVLSPFSGPERAAPDSVVGRYVYVDNDGVRNAVYRIVGATRPDARTLVLDVGDLTTIRGYVDPEDFEKGYTHDVAEGAAARIPLTREWSA